ncbi:N-6 DNA methylase [Anabaena sp. UHCC 0253]|uniref:N-6 DNA methylase n=1 Tax=Anabaena sp. UHCC 0253 TaxID=2590019 RepID=UPI0014460948|nr:N-6 DNA methylase [Anabaena sp. UHCC 0253]MTJ51971.1 N-6 DNA methylase [Anabaena sp. UHCC 0253]
MSLTTTIKSIQDIMRKDVGVDGDAQRMSQLVWMLFLKILDEQDKQMEAVKNYTSPIKEEFRWRNWAAVDKEEQPTDNQLIDFVNNHLFPGLKNIKTYQGDSKLRQVIQTVFEDAYNYMKSGSLLRQVIQKIEEDIPLKSFEDQKHLGDVYEKLLKDLQSAGNSGEFYTPRAVTEFVIDRIAPRIGETILDPACGTGGFLAQAVDYLNKSKREEGNETLQKIQDAPRGIEKKPLPHMLAVTNMILHGIKEPFHIQRKNTLELYKDWNEDNKVDIVITNPPFGGMEEEGIENHLFNNSKIGRMYYKNHATGISIQNVSRQILLNMPVPLPPLIEQKFIVQKIENLLSLCDDLERLLKQYNSIQEKLSIALIEAIIGDQSEIKITTLMKELNKETKKNLLF